MKQTFKKMTLREQNEKEHFNYLAREFNHDWWGVGTPASKQRLERRTNIFKSLIGKSETSENILECGCGSGEFTSQLAEIIDKKTNLFSVDISNAQIEIAKSKVSSRQIEFVNSSLNSTPFQDNYFDFIVGNSVLHHLDLDVFLNEIMRILKPDGKIVFFEPNLLNPQLYIVFKYGFFKKLYEASPDEKPFTRWEIKKILEEKKFSNIKVTPFDFMHPLIPKELIGFAKAVESLFEKTPLNEIAGSLIIFAENKN